MQPAQISNSTIFPLIFDGLNFLLSHLSKPEFPRTIATALTEGKQVDVYSNIEALAYYKQADYFDCRLAAYPYLQDKSPQIIDSVMLDLDLNNFGYSRQKLEKALAKILTSLGKEGIIPTVIWSGNGYHVLVPIEPLPSTLEDMAEFSKFDEPSKKILRWLEKHLSNGKSDYVHNSTVSFGNCMLRVPNSFNSKHDNHEQVQVIKEWNGQRLNIKPLMGDMLAYLLDEQSKSKSRHYGNYYNNHNYGGLLSKP